MTAVCYKVITVAVVIQDQAEKKKNKCELERWKEKRDVVKGKQD